MPRGVFVRRQETKDRMRLSHMGVKRGKHKPETIVKIKEARKYQKMVCNEETKKKISASLKLKADYFRNLYKGEKSYLWKGGISKEPYSFDFDNELKMLIRTRDDFRCQICFNRGIDVHHIDYNKKNSDPNNLITLCRSCHMKTGFNRDEWKSLFRSRLGLK